MGASTGGPGLIESIIKEMPLDFNFSLVIAQHMDTLPLKSFAKRLQRISASKKVEFVDRSVSVESGYIYVLGDTSKFILDNSALILEPTNEDSFYHPCIDTLFCSAAFLDDVALDAYLLSGIGSDGAKGLEELKKRGFFTVAQDEKSSIVFGMPRAAVELDAVCKVCSIDEMIKKIAGGF